MMTGIGVVKQDLQGKVDIVQVKIGSILTTTFLNWIKPLLCLPVLLHIFLPQNHYSACSQNSTFQSTIRTALLVDQVEKQQSKYKRISQDQSLRIVQVEESLQTKCTAVAELSANLEMVRTV